MNDRLRAAAGAGLILGMILWQACGGAILFEFPLTDGPVSLVVTWRRRKGGRSPYLRPLITLGPSVGGSRGHVQTTHKIHYQTV